MKTSLHKIHTADGIELAGLLYEPEKLTKKILVHVHGMAGNFYENRFLDFIAKTLTDNGIAFFVFNNRGCELVKDLIKIENNKKSIIRIGNQYEKFEGCMFDIATAMDFVGRKGFSEIHLSGHSLGAPKAAYYTVETKGSKIKSLIFLSPADMVGLAIANKNYKRDITTAKKMLAEGKGKEPMPFLVWDENYLSADTFMSLADESSKVAIFNFYNPKDKLSVLSKITAPTLTIMGRKDGALTVSAEETMERIKDAMTSSKKVETNILGDANHAYDNDEQKLADTILQWIQKK